MPFKKRKNSAEEKMHIVISFLYGISFLFLKYVLKITFIFVLQLYIRLKRKRENFEIYVSLNIEGLQHFNSYIILSFQKQPKHNPIKFPPPKKNCFWCTIGAVLSIIFCSSCKYLSHKAYRIIDFYRGIENVEVLKCHKANQVRS